MRLHSFIVIALMVYPCLLQADTANYGEQLAKLRAQVNDLSNEIDKVRSDTKAQRLSLEGQRTDLEILLRKEEIQRDTLKRLRAKRQAEKIAVESWSAKLMQPAKQAIALLSKLIEQSLPFKKDQRKAAVNEIETSLISSHADPVVAISRLWQLLEDELKLTTESSLQRQVITIGQEQLLVEVVHVGMSVLYFKTEDERYGMAFPATTGYTFHFLEEPAHIEAVTLLFDALKKQVKKGYFELPLPPRSLTKEREHDE